jgi:capsule polysaccharide export protein KpsC/LpsZ
VVIPLQGHVRRQRSFQAASPMRMVRDVAEIGRPCTVTLHPKEVYDDQDLAALHGVAAAHSNLTIGGDTKALLRDCAFVVTQNSGVGFDALILDKPVVLYGLSDFHHIALNVSQMGAAKALARAVDHKPPFAKYLDWFLRRTSLDMMAADADDRLLAAMKKGGWPV